MHFLLPNMMIVPPSQHHQKQTESSIADEGPGFGGFSHSLDERADSPMPSVMKDRAAWADPATRGDVASVSATAGPTMAAHCMRMRTLRTRLGGGAGGGRGVGE